MARLLLVEDDKDVAATVGQLLLRAGHDVRLARDISFAVQSAPWADVAVVDQNLPGASGVEVIETLRALRPGMRAVLATGDTSLELSQAANRLGVERVVKPYLSGELVDAVERVLADGGPDTRGKE